MKINSLRLTMLDWYTHASGVFFLLACVFDYHDMLSKSASLFLWVIVFGANIFAGQWVYQRERREGYGVRQSLLAGFIPYLLAGLAFIKFVSVYF